jgi:hypothetical protein
MSIFTVTEAELVKPAPSVAVQVIVVPAVSVPKVTVPHPEDDAIPDSGSETLQVTVKGPLFQPLPFGFGVVVGRMTGGVVSTVKVVAFEITVMANPELSVT